MVGRRVTLPVGGNAQVQDQEVERTPTHSPRTTTICLMYVEDSLEGIHSSLNNLQETVATLLRRLDALTVLDQHDENATAFYQVWGRRGRCGAGQPGKFQIQQEIHQERAPRMHRQVQEDPRRQTEYV